MLSGWTLATNRPPVKALFEEQAHEFRWHAELWVDRLPGDAVVTVSGLTSAPNAGTAAFFRCLAEMSDLSSDVEKLTAVYRVLLPRLLNAYTSHLDGLDEGPNGSMQRALRLVIADELAAWRAGENLLESLLVDDEALICSLRVQRKLESLLIDSGGLVALAA